MKAFGKSFLCFLGFLFVLPVSIFGFLLFLLLLVTRQIEKVKIGTDFVCVVDMLNNGWFFKRVFWNRGWVGYSIGCYVFVKDINVYRLNRTLAHEKRHCYQQYVLGVLFYPVYILDSVLIWLFQPEKHSYYDNWFERDARKAAGQLLDIPKSRWRSGPGDRWAWW